MNLQRMKDFLKTKPSGIESETAMTADARRTAYLSAKEFGENFPIHGQLQWSMEINGIPALAHLKLILGSQAWTTSGRSFSYVSLIADGSSVSQGRNLTPASST